MSQHAGAHIRMKCGFVIEPGPGSADAIQAATMQRRIPQMKARQIIIREANLPLFSMLCRLGRLTASKQTKLMIFLRLYMSFPEAAVR